jgi:hypothetical protein
VPLGNVDPNVRRRLRSSSTTTEAAPPWLAKRPQRRAPILFTQIESNRPRPRGRLLILLIDETLRLQGRPQILPIDETLRPQGRLITLSIYQDLIADHELPLQASSLALLPVPYDLAYEVPLQAANLALLLVCRFRAYLSAFEPLASLHSLGLMLHKCEFCTALYFIQEAVAST